MINNILFVDDERSILDTYQEIFSEKSWNRFLQEMTPRTQYIDLDELIPQNIQNENFLDQFRIFLSNNGMSAVDTVKLQFEINDPIKVAFVDIRMPLGINGIETAIKIREIDPNIEFVMVTSLTELRPLRNLNLLGCPDKILFLKKPFEIDEVRQVALNLTTKYNNFIIKEELLSNMSSELITPIGSALGHISLLQKDKKITQKQREILHNIQTNVQFMKETMDYFFDIGLVQANLFQINRSNTTVNTMLLKVDQLASSYFLSENFKNYSQSNLTEDQDIYVDESKLIHAIFTLLKKAFQLENQGEILLETKEVDGNLAIQVKNTQLTYSNKIFEKIFRKFFSWESIGIKRQGPGLGLSLVKKIVTLHDGMFDIESDPNSKSQTIFKINLLKEKISFKQDINENKEVTEI